MDEAETGPRRRTAALLQQYLKRRARAGLSTHPGDWTRVAREMREELAGGAASAELIYRAWVDLLRMGLIVVRPSATGESAWWPVDVPGPAGEPRRRAALHEVHG